MIVTRPKTARYDVSTLIKIGIDRRGLLPPLPQCLQKSSIAKQAKNWSRAYGTVARIGTLPPRPYIVCGNSVGVWSKNDDFKIRHGITCTSCYFPESVSYRAMESICDRTWEKGPIGVVDHFFFFTLLEPALHYLTMDT